MANCGCDSNTSSDSCYPNNNIVGSLALPITNNNCLGNSGSASTCPPYFTTSTPTTGDCFTIPAVGATFNLPLVCNASQFNVGQWVQIGSAGGKYPVVGKNSATNLLTLQNSCSDGTTAITGNPDPGTMLCGTQQVWITGSSPCLDEEAACDAAIACLQSISDDNPLCTPDFPLTTDGECVFMLGLTSACDSGDCPQPEDPKCWKVNTNLRFCKDTICFTDGLAMAGEDETVRSVGITEDGCLRQSLGGAFVSLRVKMLEVSVTDDTGSAIASAMTESIDLVDFGVPSGATAAAIRVFYIYQPDASEDDGLYFSTYIRGAAEATNSSGAYLYDTVRQINLGGSDPIPDSMYATVPLTPTDKQVYHEWQNLGSSGNNNSFRMVISLDGYYA